jgi:hypothetical protein
MHWLMTLIILFAFQTESNFHKDLYYWTTASKLQLNTEGATINSSVSVVLTQKTLTGATAKFSSQIILR